MSATYGAPKHAAEKFVQGRIDSGKGTVSNRAVIHAQRTYGMARSHALPETPTPRGFFRIQRRHILIRIERRGVCVLRSRCCSLCVKTDLSLRWGLSGALRLPTACAVGCILAPLRGYVVALGSTMSSRFLVLTHKLEALRHPTASFHRRACVAGT
jgi:hypothetical protein